MRCGARAVTTMTDHAPAAIGRRVAELLGWDCVDTVDDLYVGHGIPFWRGPEALPPVGSNYGPYSATRIAMTGDGMAAVLEAMRAREMPMTLLGANRWTCTIVSSEGEFEYSRTADTAPRAVALAAIAALEANNPERMATE